MSQEPQLTPMMAQYRRIKGELPRDALLFFRLGDFYEMFFEDAISGAQLLNLALTKRGDIPMCGIPYHAANGYIARLLKAGRKVAICEQLEEARPGQLVRREVTQILSPGTHFDERLLAPERNNFLAALCPCGKIFGLAVVDLTTGDFKTTQLAGEAALRTELERLRPAEIIYPAAAETLTRAALHSACILNAYEDWVFAPETALFTVRDHFKVASLDGFGLKDCPAAVGAVGAVLHYLTQHLRRDVAALTRLSFYQCSAFMALDAVSLRNLEILEPQQPDAARGASLYGALRRTVTPMGARRLRDWLSQPLAAVAPILQRRDAVQLWLENSALLDDFRRELAEVRDLERTVGRLSVGSGNGRDLLALRLGLEKIPTLKGVLASLSGSLRELPGVPPPPRDPGLMDALAVELSESPDLVELIGRALVDEPPLALKEGGLIRDGFDSNLDELRAATRDGKEWIAQLQRDEMSRTGIASLKVRFNSVFGYYIEVTKSNLDKVPPHYLRKQTIANGERFITPELKEMEGKILGAEERSQKLEYELFQRVREEVLGQLPRLQRTAAALSQLDVLASFAETARLYNYCRPEIGDEGILEIRDGRHPVLEQNLGEERFVPNDVQLNQTSHQVMLITGPNMAGKSTFIRQVALITLLAHIGSFVPAASARVDLVDRIFTRIGASDDLARGQSTFMVEMSETANILNNATPRSLIILDEIGRGTSTFDGLSLAWSIVEHLHNAAGAKTLFATHYHELTELAGRLPRVRNYNVAVREWNEQIVFLRKIIEGGTDKSYGIQVARLAGVPRSVISRAREILSNLEQSELTPEGKIRPQRRPEIEKLKKTGAAATNGLIRMKPLIFFTFLCLAVNTNAVPLDNLMPVRGFCIAAPHPDHVDQFAAFIDHELAPRHVNTLILRVDYNYQFESHPELRDSEALSRADVKKLVGVCRKDGIKLIPQINLLGHQSFRTHLGKLLQVYPEFDETPWVKLPEKYKWPNPEKLYCKSYCPLQPKVHEVIFAVMDELCQVFETDAFHAGMDEVFYIGEDKCPRCGGRDRAELFADEVRRIHDHLREKNRRLWIWGDRLLDGKTTGLGEWEASYRTTARAIDLIPKDVMICDWHYERPDPTAVYFAMKGFDVVTCPWKSSSIAVQQTDDMLHWRTTTTPEMQRHFCGMMQTVWDGAETFLSQAYAGKGNPTNSWNCFQAVCNEVTKKTAD